jgi:hypothetical protein
VADTTTPGRAITWLPTANAFTLVGAAPTHLIAALPEIDNDVAVAAFRDHATILTRETSRDVDRFAAEACQR